MSILKIKTATAADKGPVIRTIAQAFSADTAARWIFPDAQYVNCSPNFVAAFAAAERPFAGKCALGGNVEIGRRKDRL